MAETRKNHETTGWVGWVYFAGLLMMLSGLFQIIAGLVALFKNTIYVAGSQNLLVLDFNQWGWVHLLVGVVLFLSSFSVLSGGAWGRFLGSILAGLSAISNFTFISVYPVWSTIVIAIDVLIIYALLVHGPEARPRDNI